MTAARRRKLKALGRAKAKMYAASVAGDRRGLSTHAGDFERIARDLGMGPEQILRAADVKKGPQASPFKARSYGISAGKLKVGEVEIPMLRDGELVTEEEWFGEVEP